MSIQGVQLHVQDDHVTEIPSLTTLLYSIFSQRFYMFKDCC